jgi:hypothetical protein
MTDEIRDIVALDGDRIILDAVVIGPSGRKNIQLVLDTGAVRLRSSAPGQTGERRPFVSAGRQPVNRMKQLTRA